MIDVIRISQHAKEQLVWLKRQTGIMQWNVLCRWALCLSLSDPTPLGEFDDAADSNVEMRWEVFAGEYEAIYLAIIVERYKKNGYKYPTKNLTRFIRQHIHRGINKLQYIKDISKLVVVS